MPETTPSSSSSSTVSSATVPEEFGANEWLVEEMYERFQSDPSSVDQTWVDYFKAHGAGLTDGSAGAATRPNGAPGTTTTASTGASTNGTGSAGTALVLERKALLFVDGRYTLQARNQVDPSIFSIENLIDNPPDKWLGANLARGDRIGFDPWLHTISDAKELRAAIAGRDGELVAVERNPVDACWPDRPGPPLGWVR